MADVLISKLKTIRSNFSVGLYCYCLLRRLKPEEVSVRDRVIVGEDSLHCVPAGKNIPQQAGQFYEAGFAGSPDFNISHAAMEFAKMLLRNFTLDSFEAVKGYCEETGQFAQLRSQPWYEFTRMMRNSLTHAQRWHFRDKDRRRVPVRWRDKIIDASMEGTEPPFDFYDWWDGCELWEEMNAFAAALR